MKSALDRVLAKARLRCWVNLLLEQLAWALLAAGVVGALAVAAERTFALNLFRPWMLGPLAGAAVLVAAILWLVRLPGRMQVALLIDDKLALRERFSTALALSGSTDPFAVAARAETQELAGRLNVKSEFRLRPTRPWLGSLSTWALTAGLILFLPTFDLLGNAQRKKDKDEQGKQLAVAQAEVKKAIEKVTLTVRQMNDPETTAELAKLSQATDAAKPEEVKRQAIKKLEELADKVEKKLELPKLEGTRDLKDMLKGMRGTPDTFSRELGQAVAKAEFKQAADILKQIQKQLDEGKLTEQQKQALAKQLNEMGQQLKELAKQNQDLKDALEKQGLSKDLAKLDPEKLKEALKKEGLSEDKIKELAEKAEACQNASAAAKNLGDKMADAGSQGGQPGKLSEKDLSELEDQLSQLEGMNAELAGAEAALNDLKQAMAGLGKTAGEGEEGEGMGGTGEYAEGNSGVRGAGTGGPGQGYGARATGDPGPTALEQTLAKSKTNEGPAVASWFYKGPQVKGESQKELKQILQAAKDTAAEAINENEIPRKYEGSVKKYFSELEESGKPK